MAAWFFWFALGYQGVGSKEGNGMYALAVRDGDVIVPGVLEPETYALMLLGLAGVAFATKHRARSA